MDELTKQEAKALRSQHRDFRAKFRVVAAKIRRIKITTKEKESIISDLLKCNNNEIMHYLSKATFKTVEAYNSHINKWLELESICYEYPQPLIYNGSNFEVLTSVIIKRHRYLDLKKAIFRM